MAHQKESVSFLKERPRVFDASDPGTGKTLVHILDYAARRKRGAKCCLVIAPKSLLMSAWGNDIKKGAPHLKFSCAFAANREAAFNVEADVYITNTDAVRWLSNKPKSFFDRFDHLIVDEISNFKHHTSQRSRSLCKIKKYFAYRRGLSGTPNGNGICDIWHPMFVLDDGKHLGKSFYAFRGAACQAEQVGPNANMVKWVDKPGIEASVAVMIQDVTIRHKFEECIDIPPNHLYSVPFQLTAKHRKLYEQMKMEKIAELKKGSITAVNAAAAYTKLLQIASGAAYGDGATVHIDSDRYELIADLIEQRKHCVVFYLWDHQRDNLMMVLEKRGISFTVLANNANEVVKAYQAGMYRVLLAHPKSAAHGLTLTKGTATIWASPTSDLELFAQGRKRIHRNGQTEKTETIVVIAEDTLDEVVYERCIAKGEKMTNMLEMLE